MTMSDRCGSTLQWMCAAPWRLLITQSVQRFGGWSYSSAVGMGCMRNRIPRADLFDHSHFISGSGRRGDAGVEIGVEGSAEADMGGTARWRLG